MCGPSHCTAGPWQASHATPSDSDFSGDPTTWQTAQRLSRVASAMRRISAIRLPRGSSSFLYASAWRSATAQVAYSLPRMRLCASGKGVVAPWQFEDAHPPAPTYVCADASAAAASRTATLIVIIASPSTRQSARLPAPPRRRSRCTSPSSSTSRPRLRPAGQQRAAPVAYGRVRRVRRRAGRAIAKAQPRRRFRSGGRGGRCRRRRRGHRARRHGRCRGTVEHLRLFTVDRGRRRSQDLRLLRRRSAGAPCDRGLHEPAHRERLLQFARILESLGGVFLQRPIQQELEPLRRVGTNLGELRRRPRTRSR